MKHIEDLNLPEESLDLITKGFLKGEKLKMFLGAVTYFDNRVGALREKYTQDVKDLSRRQVFIEGFHFLNTHGNGSNDYRRDYLRRAQQYILVNPFPLIDIGTIVNVFARCQAHLLFYREAEFIGKHNEIIEALKPKFQSKKELIEALNKSYPEASIDAWKKRVQRFDKREASGTLKRDKPD